MCACGIVCVECGVCGGCVIVMCVSVGLCVVFALSVYVVCCGVCVVCVCVCDLATSTIKRLRPELGCCTT